MNILFDYSKLKGKIKEKLGTQREYAKALGYSEKTISKKLSNQTPFTQKDIEKSIKVLDLESADPYFFKK